MAEKSININKEDINIWYIKYHTDGISGTTKQGCLLNATLHKGNKPKKGNQICFLYFVI
jgi:hypothetical protein